MTRIQDDAQPRTSHSENQVHTLELVVANATSQSDIPVRRPRRQDLYDVLGVSRNATFQEIKKAYQRMALKYHPDKNGDDPVASDMFVEVNFSYKILSDPYKRRQYDVSGFEAIESNKRKSELDLSNLGHASTMFLALLSKLGIPIKTAVPVTLLEDALNGVYKDIRLMLGESDTMKVNRLSAHFYSVVITEQEAKTGIICRVHSTDRSKFKLLYFTLEENGGLDLALQEDSVDTGNVTSAGMFFLGFPVYRFQHNYRAAAAKNSHTTFFKMLDSFQSCDIDELKPGTHHFAVYGDNFLCPTSYTIEIMCGQSFPAEKEKLQNVEAKILGKQAEYREVSGKGTDMKGAYTQEMKTIDELMKERNEIHAYFNTNNARWSSTMDTNANSPSEWSEGNLEISPRKQKKEKGHRMEQEDNDSNDKKSNVMKGGCLKFHFVN